MKIAPHGLGMLDQKIQFKTPRAAVERLGPLGVRWYSVCGPWHDTKGRRWINRPDKIAEFADALSRAGIVVHVWGYPSPTSIPQFVDDLVACISPGVVAIGHDAEVLFKGKEADARVLAAGVRERARARDVLSFGTSYGVIKFHRTFPFQAFVGAVDFWCPQVYTHDSTIDEALLDAAQLGFDHIVPFFGLFRFDAAKKAISKSAAELQNHLAEGIESPIAFNAFGVWEASFLRRDHEPILKRWGALIERGAGALPPCR